MNEIAVARELLRVAKELAGSLDRRSTTNWPSQDAMDKYLKEHPGADKSNHRVKKPSGDGGKNLAPIQKPKGEGYSEIVQKRNKDKDRSDGGDFHKKFEEEGKKKQEGIARKWQKEEHKEEKQKKEPKDPTKPWQKPKGEGFSEIMMKEQEKKEKEAASELLVIAKRLVRKVE